MKHDPNWLTQPIRFPFPFLPMPSIAATVIAAALCCAFLCWGMFLIPRRWPFKFMEPVFPAYSRIWMAMAVLLSLAAGAGIWKLVHPADLAIACAWDLLSAILLIFRLRATPGRSTQTHLKTSMSDSTTREE